jgi:lysophospholipase L1-like esterase
VLHLGDSTIGLDGIPNAIRKRFQARFGDGGAGFVLLDRYSLNYKNLAVRLEPNGAWTTCYIAYRCRKDGHYGLGGVTVSSTGGAKTVISTRGKGDVGRTVSRFELWYAAQPHGGTVRVRIDREKPVIVDTNATQLEDRWRVLDVDEGPHRISVQAIRGRVRAYGVVLETEGPGVVWDTISLIGCFTKRLLSHDPDHIRAQIAHRDPDLLVLTFGGNDLKRMHLGKLDGAQYEREVLEVLEHLRGTESTRVPCLLTGVVDHGRLRAGKVIPHKHVTELIEAQRRAAFAAGCAFFDARAAMGGEGSILDWLRRRPPLASPDLKHLTRRGRDLMGDMIYRALVAGYVAYGRRQAPEEG